MPALVLDIGGIFFSPAWRERGIHEVSKKIATNYETFARALKINKDDFYEGRIPESAFWDKVLNDCNVEYSTSEMALLYRRYISPIEENLALLPLLAKSNVLISCNNSPREWMDERIKITNLEKYFIYFCTSGYVGAQKPSPKMYALMFDYAKSISKSIVYVDDNQKYIDTAEFLYPELEVALYADTNTLARFVR